MCSNHIGGTIIGKNMKAKKILRFIFPPYPHRFILGRDIGGGEKSPLWMHGLSWFNGRINDGWSWIAHRTWDRRHVIRTDLDPGWVDADERMLRACFAVLKDYVENELGTESWYPEDPSCMHRGFRVHSAEGNDQKAIDLWIWYRDELPKIEAEYIDCVRKRKYHKFNKKYGCDDPDDMKDAKLKELIDLRRSLWT